MRVQSPTLCTFTKGPRLHHESQTGTEEMRTKACRCTVLIGMVEEFAPLSQRSHKLSSAGEMPAILAL